jgi:protein-tyrosine phosphatase
MLRASTMKRAQDLDVVFLCLGNHCRSPAAEAVARAHLERASITNVTVRSCGTNTDHLGQAAHALTVTEGESRGYALKAHRGRRLSARDFADATLIVAMDHSNLATIEQMRSALRAATEQYVYPGLRQVQLLRRWDPLAATEHAELDDPWGHPRAAYVTMYDVIERCIPPLLAELVALG